MYKLVQRPRLLPVVWRAWRFARSTSVSSRSTLGDDGDPLDVMVLMDEPAHVTGLPAYLDVPGIINRRRALSKPSKQKRAKPRRTTGSWRSPSTLIITKSHQGSLEDVDRQNSSGTARMNNFFISYNKSRGKKLAAQGELGPKWHGPKRAAQLIETGIKKFKKKK